MFFPVTFYSSLEFILIVGTFLSACAGAVNKSTRTESEVAGTIIR